MLCMQTQRIMSHTWSQNTVRAAMPRGYVACSEPKKKKEKKERKGTRKAWDAECVLLRCPARGLRAPGAGCEGPMLGA